MNKWSSYKGKPKSHVFDVIPYGSNAAEIRRISQNFIRTTNKWHAKIAERLDIEKITTYTARHSFSNVMRSSGASIELIGDMLGHETTSTTEVYLDGFKDDIKKMFAGKLMFYKE